MSKDLIKQDINLLEYPIWFQDAQLAHTLKDGYLWKDKEGFIYRAGYKPPVKTDLLFLLYFLMLAQRNKYNPIIETTRFSVLKGCDITDCKDNYERLKDSLERWKMVGIKFEGTFYNGKAKKIMNFGIIDHWEINKETKILQVRFSPEYLLLVQNSSFFRYINFTEIKTLRTPLAIRLFELLSKSFQGRQTWEIEALKLAQKIPIAEKYPSHILLKIRPAVSRISKHTALKVSLKTRENENGEMIFIFEKKHVQKQEKQQIKESTNTFVAPENEEFKKLIAILPLERQAQKTLLELILKAFNAHGFDYVVWNIQYANKRAIGNYPAYLLKALKHNFGATLKEEVEVTKQMLSKRKEAEKVKAIKQSEDQVKEQQNTEVAQQILKSLSAEDLETVEQEAFKRLPSFLKQSFDKAKKDKNISFQGMLRLIALEKINGKPKEAASRETKD